MENWSTSKNDFGASWKRKIYPWGTQRFQGFLLCDRFQNRFWSVLERKDSTMNQQIIKSPGNPNWKKGVSGNAAGRPLGARQKIAEKLLADLAEVWEAAGKQVLARLANDDPAKLATIAFGLLPRDVFVQVAQAAPGGLNAEEWSQLRGVLDAIEAARLGDVEPSEIFAGISTYLRSEFAKTIEHQAEPVAIPAPPF
jgi:hypothetical protein